MRIRSKKIYLILLALFILLTYCSIILIDQCWQAKKSQSRSNSTSMCDHFDIDCYDHQYSQKHQALSLVEPLNDCKISSWQWLTDKALFARKRLINQLKDMSNGLPILLKYRIFNFKISLEEVQAKNIRLLKLFHSQDNLQFMRGLVLGEKSPEAAYLPDFANAGMLHVLVASGFNVALVASLAWVMVKNLPKLWQLLGILTLIWFYVFLLEFQPPLLRAAWMFSLVFLLKFVGIRTSRRRVLAWSVVVILVFQPALLSSLSLWLSVLATLGIVTFSRRLTLFWRDDNATGSPMFSSRIAGIFLEEGSVSLAAQALIFPLLIWFFQSANFVSFLANPVLLPWLGGITQAAGLEFLLSLLEKYWPARVLLASLAEVTNWVLDQYLSVVAWWKPFFFLNRTAVQSTAWRYIAVWAVIITGLYFLTRRNREEKAHFFHEKA